MTDIFQKHLDKLKELNENINNAKTNITGTDMNEFNAQLESLINSIGKESHDNMLIKIYLKDLINDIMYKEEEYIQNKKATLLLEKEIYICGKLSNQQTINEKLKKFKEKFSNEPTKLEKINLLNTFFDNFFQKIK
jgi:hypothetical protein